MPHPRLFLGFLLVSLMGVSDAIQADEEAALRQRIEQLEQTVSDLLEARRAMERELMTLRSAAGDGDQASYVRGRYRDHGNVTGDFPCVCGAEAE